MFSTSTTELNKQNMSHETENACQAAMRLKGALSEFGKVAGVVPDEGLTVDGVAKTSDRDAILDFIDNPIEQLVVKDAAGKIVIETKNVTVADLLTEIINRTTITP